MGLILFGLHKYRNNSSPNQSVIVAHQILSPIACTAVIAWICVACLSGYGGVANKFLSLDIFGVMDRLTLWIYLLHPLFILYLFGEFRNPLPISQINLYMTFLLVMTLSIIASVFCYVFLQIPFSHLLSKMLFSENYKRNIANDNENQSMKTFEK
ncbi:O-acyltransferase like protein-like [Centruroides vittatus]|uniref:O-acyltransferase like protein-like n=1 Tax=Centruroides vittatus TaxID=120091 RepID=UPI00350FF934